MRSLALALASMMWRQHRTTHVIMLVLLAACAVAYPAIDSLRPALARRATFIQDLPLTVIPMGIALLWALVVATFSETDPRRGFSGLPAWMFTLPVRTEYLVGRVMFLGVAVVTLTYLLWAKVVFGFVGVTMDTAWPLFVLASATLAFQAAVWGLASFPWIRSLVIAAVLFLLNLMIFMPHAAAEHFSRNHSRYVWAVLATGLVAIAGGILGVRGERIGGWNPWTGVRRAMHGVYDAVWGTGKSFTTPARALAWFDWRRRSWMSVLAFAVTSTGAVVLFPITAILEPPGQMPVGSFICVVIWPLLMAATAGLTLGRSDLGGAVALSPFYATKPVSSAAIVFAKLRVLAGVTLLGFLFTIPLPILVFQSTKWRELWVNDDFSRLMKWLPADAMSLGLLICLVLIALVAATWHAAVGGLALGLTGRERAITIKSILGTLAFFGGISALLWLYQYRNYWDAVTPWLYPALMLMQLWKLLSAARSFRALNQSALVNHRQFLSLLACWGVVAAFVVTTGMITLNSLAIPAWLGCSAVVFLMPAGQLPQAFLNLDQNRHR
jgi:branched-subunit amino acid transport protein AzlD